MFLPRPSRVPLLVDPFQQAHDIRQGSLHLRLPAFPASYAAEPVLRLFCCFADSFSLFCNLNGCRDGLCSLVSLEFPCEIYEIKVWRVGKAGLHSV